MQKQCVWTEYKQKGRRGVRQVTSSPNAAHVGKGYQRRREGLSLLAA